MVGSRNGVLLLALAAVLASGCNPAGKAIGKWEADMDRLKAQLPAAGDNPLAAMAANMALMLPMKMELEFKADGTWTSQVEIAALQSLAGSQSQDGTWRYARTEGDTLVLLAKRAGAAEESEFKLKFADDDHVDITGPISGQSLPLKRKRES
jgi:hypothetical protein